MRPVLFLLLLSMALLAQDPGSAELQDLTKLLEQPIQSASKRLQRLKEAPVDATILTGVELRALGYRTLGEALEGVLGFGTNQDRAYTAVTSRGLGVLGDLNTRVLILLDGHTLNAGAGVESSMVGEDLGIPLERIDRIEVIRGPSSALYGNKALQGLISIITRPIEEGGSASLEAQGRGGHGLWAQAGAKTRGVSWDLLATGWKRPGTALTYPELRPESLPREADRESRQSARFRALGEGWSLVGYATSRTQHHASAPFSATIGDPATLYTDSLMFGEFKLEKTIGKVQTLVRLFGDRYLYKDDFAYDGTRDPGLTQPYHEYIPDFGLGAELQGRVNFGEQGTLMLGLERQWHRWESRVHVEGEDQSQRVKNGTLNSYLQGDWRFTEAISLMAGVQYATFELNRAEKTVGGSTYPFEQKSNQGLTPRFALTLNPSSIDTVKVLYGGGYRYPTYYERYYEDGAAFISNPGLEPETIRTAQAIWVRTFEVGVQAQVSVTESRWKDLIEYKEVQPGIQQAVNTPGQIRGRSAEFELQSRKPDWIWMVQGGLYRWQMANGEDFPNSARAQGAMRLTRKWQNLSASGELRYLGRREHLDQGTSAPAVTVLRFALRWDESRFWITGTLEDALNAKRVDLVPLDYLPINRMASDGRTWRLSLGWRF